MGTRQEAWRHRECKQGALKHMDLRQGSSDIGTLHEEPLDKGTIDSGMSQSRGKLVCSNMVWSDHGV